MWMGDQLVLDILQGVVAMEHPTQLSKLFMCKAEAVDIAAAAAATHPEVATHPLQSKLLRLVSTKLFYSTTNCKKSNCNEGTVQRDKWFSSYLLCWEMSFKRAKLHSTDGNSKHLLKKKQSKSRTNWKQCLSQKYLSDCWWWLCQCWWSWWWTRRWTWSCSSPSYQSKQHSQKFKEPPSSIPSYHPHSS